MVIAVIILRMFADAKVRHADLCPDASSDVAVQYDVRLLDSLDAHSRRDMPQMSDIGPDRRVNIRRPVGEAVE